MFRSFDDAKRAHPRLEELLAKQPPHMFAKQLVPVKLDFLPLFHACVAGRIKTGSVTVGLHWKLSQDQRTFEPNEVRNVDSSLIPEDTELAMGCANQAFKQPIPIDSEEDAQPELMFGTRLDFPQESDVVYEFVDNLK